MSNEADNPSPRLLAAPTQRRENHRVQTRIWVRVEMPYQTTVELTDISLGGACLSGELPCMPGTKINLVLELPSIGDVAIAAEVVRVGNEQTGVHFRMLTAQDSEKLRSALMKAELRNLLSAEIRTQSSSS
jgi:c-di-GMP-binding flagellar brake protein YcgR